MFIRKMSGGVIEIPVKTQKLLQLWSLIVPKLTDVTKIKGNFGRVGVVGGSLEYTGAPYFAAISSLRTGADLAHVFCQKEAASVIKSYSPDLIVHPVLDGINPIQEIESWLERLHILVIGPGLGRQPNIHKNVADLIGICRRLNKPIIIDADGLSLLAENMDLIYGQNNVILTPNAIEFRRLFSNNYETVRERMGLLGAGVIVLEKGANDRIHIPSTSEIYTLPPGGSGRRCGGQGDLLSGSLATFYHWALESNQSNPGFLAAFAASYLIKKCNSYAFKKFGRSMLASDMVQEISVVFRDTFEIPSCGVN